MEQSDWSIKMHIFPVLLQDDPNLYDYNVDYETDVLIKEIYAYAKVFATNHIMFTFGSDFQYENAKLNFDNMDKLIRYTNKKVCQ